MPSNALSAHLFFGALCTALRCMDFAERAVFTGISVVHGKSPLK
jgi:hypothetical protein